MLCNRDASEGNAMKFMQVIEYSTSQFAEVNKLVDA